MGHRKKNLSQKERRKRALVRAVFWPVGVTLIVALAGAWLISDVLVPQLARQDMQAYQNKLDHMTAAFLAYAEQEGHFPQLGQEPRSGEDAIYFLTFFATKFQAELQRKGIDVPLVRLADPYNNRNIVLALDTNGDGVISANRLNNLVVDGLQLKVSENIPARVAFISAGGGSFITSWAPYEGLVYWTPRDNRILYNWLLLSLLLGTTATIGIVFSVWAHWRPRHDELPGTSAIAGKKVAPRQSTTPDSEKE